MYICCRRCEQAASTVPIAPTIVGTIARMWGL